MEEIFAKHRLACLQFSGGKDSLACLWMIERWWGKTIVLWINAGYPTREVQDLMGQVRSMVPLFYQFDTDRQGTEGSMRECCFRNVAWPGYQAFLNTGASLLIRGTRRGDGMPAPSHMPYETLYPVYDWTDEEVKEYLKDKPLGVPSFYERMKTSPGCSDCTKERI